MPQDQRSAMTSRKPDLAKIRRTTDSARTSFALSPAAIEAMDWLVERLRSPKEVFERLLDPLVLEWLRTLNSGETESGSEVHIPDMPLPENAIRKSFVIGSWTLKTLNSHARRQKIKRDVLVNYLLISRKKSIEEVHKKLFEEQKKAQKLLHDFRDLGSKVQREIRELLGADDPIFRAFSAEFGWLEDQVLNAVDGRLEDGEPIIEPLDSRYE